MNRIIILGQGASGKDVLKQRFINRGFRKEVSYTTREKRDGEEDGVDYHFVSKEKFMEMADNNEFVQFAEFNGNLYGTHKTEFNKGGVFIMSRKGLEKLSEEDRSSSLVIFVDISEHVRVVRLRQRGGSTKTAVDNRLEADAKEFMNFKDYDIHMTNPSF